MRLRAWPRLVSHRRQLAPVPCGQTGSSCAPLRAVAHGQSRRRRRLASGGQASEQHPFPIPSAAAISVGIPDEASISTIAQRDLAPSKRRAGHGAAASGKAILPTPQTSMEQHIPHPLQGIPRAGFAGIATPYPSPPAGSGARWFQAVTASLRVGCHSGGRISPVSRNAHPMMRPRNPRSIAIVG